MCIRWLLVAGLTLITAAQCLYARGGEASVNYSLVLYNPAKSLAGGRTLNGGGGSVGFNFGDYLTLKAELQGYSATTFTFHLPASANTAGGTFQSQGNMFTYLFGPQFNFPMVKKRIFGETLFGGANTDAYGNLFRAANVTGPLSSQQRLRNGHWGWYRPENLEAHRIAPRPIGLLPDTV